jgi:hypothetical protein
MSQRLHAICEHLISDAWMNLGVLTQRSQCPTAARNAKRDIGRARQMGKDAGCRGRVGLIFRIHNQIYLIATYCYTDVFLNFGLQAGPVRPHSQDSLFQRYDDCTMSRLDRT